ncbi:MAG: hypothetical protein ABSB70_10205 [Candidatus Velthaea sp.]
MKYRELRERLNALPDDQLDFTVTAYMRTPDGELMFPIVALRLTDAEMLGASRGTLKLTGEGYPLLVGNRALMT